jgi:peptidoglycan hydrolase-like protein with peptidoglycan-binding domain
MRPIRQGDRGPAVQDVQRRLRSLGYELGLTGIDGVFLGATLAAVRGFQHARGLHEDGVVAEETWSALVDATFTLGDRLLYLRLPHFHGHDVEVLQGALNALGFACGLPDGIFGPFTERAVREFQRNTGQPADGIAGSDTVHAVENLRHVWADKDPTAPVALKVQPARAAEVLARTRIMVCHTDEVGRALGDRLANLALAACPGARITAVPCSMREGVPADVVLSLGGPSSVADAPVVRLEAEAGEQIAARLITALETARGTVREVAVETGGIDGRDEQRLQQVAVGLLDGLCAALADVS